jgi:TRAP-type C4-dicarboxylate transport system substrate-binding protein
MRNKPRHPELSTIVILILAWAGPAAAQPVTVKMATLVPDGSSWCSILKDMAEKWKAASGGRVVLRVYPGGVAGDDPDVVRKMRQGTLSAGVLTAVGLGDIDAAVHAMSVPMMYSGDDEALAVLERMRPRLESAFEADGFVVLGWTDGGWIQFFAQKPVATPDDLRALKLFIPAGDERATEMWRAAGFQPVPLSPTEILTALQSERVQALGSSPQVAVISQYYQHAPHMTDMPWQLLLGAIVIRKATWDQIPPDVRPALRQAAQEAGQRLQVEVRRTRDRDVEAMKKRGLRVVAVDAKTRAPWEKLALSLYPKLRGGLVPAGAFDEALRYRDEYRRATFSRPPRSGPGSPPTPTDSRERELRRSRE